jgi:TorA maturation chaperone TorD
MIMETKKQTDTRLLDADLYRLLAVCFDFPGEERLTAIREISEGLSQTGFYDEEIRNMLITLHDSIDKDEIIRDYSIIFIKGGVPLSESHILKRFSSVADVSAFYKAFGFSARSGENPDAIMYELEFLALLLLKSVIAPNQEAREVTEKAYRDFLTGHAAEFAVALAKRIREGSAGIYFITVAYLLETFIQIELQKLNEENGK